MMMMVLLVVVVLVVLALSTAGDTAASLSRWPASSASPTLGLSRSGAENERTVEVCVTDPERMGWSLVFSVDTTAGATLSTHTHTSPSDPDHPSAGVDVAIVDSLAPGCPNGLAVLDRFLCATHPAASEAMAARFPLSAYAHLGANCVNTTVHRVHTPGLCKPRHRAAPCPTNNIPVPTEAQQRYQRHEIVALTHFNMATYVHSGDPACGADNWNKGVNCSDPSLFNPKKLDIDNWIASYKALGAKHAVLTAKHGCGFLLWNTSTTLPSGDPYRYAVARSDVPSFDRDVVAEFSTKLQQAGLGHGFYYSTGNNFYLNRDHFKPAGTLLPGQANVSDAEYNKLVFKHVEELWSRFGNLTEIWFDHGYAGDQKEALQKLLQEYQPDAAGFNGYGIMQSPVKWCGTESGKPSYPIWSTGCSSPTGDPTATSYCPTAVDTALQVGDTWFWTPNLAVRSLQELISVYHASVGNNGVLELDFAIDRDGLVAKEHADRYKELGDWIHSCYSMPIANVSSEGTTASLFFAQPLVVDRFMLQEAFEQGERVRGWTIDVQTESETTRVVIGTTIGYKQIVVLDTPVQAISVTLTVTSAISTPSIRTLAAFSPCFDH